MAVADGFDVGALRREDGGRRAAVVRIRAGSSSVVDVGASWGDAPPPQVLEHGGATYAVAYVRPSSVGADRTSRALGVYRLGTAPPITLLPAESDASRAYDVVTPQVGADVGAVVAWDDMAPGRGSRPTPYGVVEVASLSSESFRVESVRAIEASVSDSSPIHASASDPRLVSRSKGYWLTWIGRRPERAAAALPLPAGEVETPTEEPTFSWIDAVALDALGVPAGTPHRLTAQTGHVGSYAVAALDDSLLVVAEDDGSWSGRGGGSLEQVVWKGEGTPDVITLAHAGVEEDTPPSLLMDGAGAWAVFVGVGPDSSEGRAQLVPLGEGRSPSLPAEEPLLRRAAPLGFMGGALATATPDGTSWRLRWATCIR
jgi:hypothetical protein